jgi:hypothetical protein
LVEKHSAAISIHTTVVRVVRVAVGSTPDFLPATDQVNIPLRPKIEVANWMPVGFLNKQTDVISIIPNLFN